MFGATPGAFRNKEAAIMAAQSYAMEDGIEWTVVATMGINGECYKPCRIKDIQEAIDKGYWHYLTER